MDKTELFPQDVLDLEPALKVAGLTRIYFIDNDSDGDDGNNCVIGRGQSNDHCNRGDILVWSGQSRKHYM